MMRHSIALAVLLWLSSCGMSICRADGAEDLAAGRAALAAGELEKAQPLLSSASQALPQSVEAHLSLADCLLRMGKLDEALASYKTVLKLSPEHDQAKRLAAALSGRQRSFAETLAAAQALLELAAYGEIEPLLAPALTEPHSPEQRQAARLLLIQSRLWGQLKLPILAEAQRLMHESKDPAVTGPSRVLAALSLAIAANNREQAQQAIELVQAAGELPAVWKSRADLVRLLADLEQPERAAQVSSKLSAALAQLPAGAFRSAAINRSSSVLLKAVWSQIEQGNRGAAMEIVWPMISSGPLPDAAIVLKPVELSGGWLWTPHSASGTAVDLARVLAALGNLEHAASPDSGELVGYRLAAMLLSKTTTDEAVLNASLQIAGEIGNLSRAPAHPRAGIPLSTADAVQRAVLIEVASRLVGEKQRASVVALIKAHVERYQGAGQLETGLSQFVSVVAGEGGAANTLKIQWAGSLDRLAAGPAQTALVTFLVDRFTEPGAREFQDAATTLAANANQTLNKFDQAALTLAALLASAAADTPNATAQGVIQRYAAAEHWSAAAQAVRLYYANRAEASRFELLKLKITQAQRAEELLLAAKRALPKELPPQVQEALSEATAMLAAQPDKATREAVLEIVRPLIQRYLGFERPDLAESVVKATADVPAGASLADWALYVRANLWERQAARSLALLASQADGQPPTALVAAHKSELPLLHKLIAEHAESEYYNLAVERFSQIATVYLNLRAYPVARAVLAEFLESHGKLTVAARFEYEAVKVYLHSAEFAFGQRKDPNKPPQLLAEHKAALDALAAFLKAHPTGVYSAAAEDDLFALVRVYAQAGAWPVARQVLTQFASTIPDYHSPGQLKLFQAATYLGELDAAYGLNLLNLAQHPVGKPGEAGEISALASIFDAEGDKLALDASGAFSDLPGKDGLSFGIDARIAGPASGGFGGGSGGMPLPRISGISNGAVGSPAPGASPTAPPASQPSDTAIAMIRQSQQRQYQQLAMLEGKQGGAQQAQAAELPLPSGVVLSEVELKRQDTAADLAYAILLDLIKNSPPEVRAISNLARQQVMWLIGFFEGQQRSDRAIVLIEQYLKDRPLDPARLALSYRAITDQFALAVERKPTERMNQAWLDQRHERFETGRQRLAAFLKTVADKTDWVQQASLRLVESYQQEAQLAASVSAIRAGGLWVRTAEELNSLLQKMPNHPEVVNFPQRTWDIAAQLDSLGLEEQAIYVLGRIPIRFPTHALANQAVLRIAGLYAANLSNPLRAVETYQEYLSLTGDNESVRSQVFSIAQQLASRQRFLEALHVYGVFVDSFPTDARAPEALRSIGLTHQSNEAWEEAIKAYQRILEEYPQVPIIPQVKLAVAEVQINLGHWRSARNSYEGFLEKFPNDGQAQTARLHVQVLKNLERYDALLNDQQIQRNKDDAQFQIGRIVLEQLGNPIKAIAEFRKVVTNFAKSDQADDAQLAIGQAMIGLGRMEDARTELLLVAAKYPGSPLADDALYLIAQSYERQAQQLAGVTVEKAREEAFGRNRRGAYRAFNEQLAQQGMRQAVRRDALKKSGESELLALDEASSASLLNPFTLGNISNSSRKAEIDAECESALQVANRQDRINEAYRQAVEMYGKAVNDYPLGDKTDEALLRVAQILETELKDRIAAMQTYQKIVKLFPGTPVAEDAAWKVAQFHEQEGKYTLAASAYRDFIRNYPASGRVADAQFALAEVLEQLGQWVDAMDAYEIFRQKFNSHPKALLAMEQINWIKTYRK